MPVDPIPPKPPARNSLVIEDLSKENMVVRVLAWIIKKLM